MHNGNVPVFRKPPYNTNRISLRFTTSYIHFSTVRSAESLNDSEAFLSTVFYVYIIQSKVDGTYYKSSSELPFQRLAAHNAGLSQYTSGKLP